MTGSNVKNTFTIFPKKVVGNTNGISRMSHEGEVFFPGVSNMRQPNQDAS